MIDHNLLSPRTAFTTYVHEHDSSQLYDASCSQSRILQKVTSAIEVAYGEYGQEAMPAPYDTNCYWIPPIHNFTGNFTSGTEYQFHILNQLSKKYFHRIVPFVQTYENSTYKLILESDFHDQDFLKKFKSIFDHIQPLRGCSIKMFLSRYDVFDNSEPWGTFLITVGWPRSTKVYIIFTAKQDLIEYIIYVCSIAGIWFGLSILSIFSSIQKFTPYVLNELGCTYSNTSNQDSTNDDTELDSSYTVKNLKNILLDQEKKMKVSNLRIRYLFHEIEKLKHQRMQ